MSPARRNWIDAFYWIGVTLTLACFAFVIAGNTELVGRFEHRGFPLSWAIAIAAVLAFLAAEACHPTSSGAIQTEARTSLLASKLELEAVESQG